MICSDVLQRVNVRSYVVVDVAGVCRDNRPERPQAILAFRSGTRMEQAAPRKSCRCFDVHVRSDVLRRASLQKIKEALCDACMSA